MVVRTISSLLKKYETKQPGETWSKKMEHETKMQWRLSQKLRIAENRMSRLGIKGNDRKRVLFIIKDISNFKILCKKCRNETIISAICFYVMKSNKSYIKMKDFSVFKEDGLDYYIYSTIVTKISNHYQSKTLLKY